MDFKHSAEDLKQLQALPLSAKILRTKALIRAWYEHFEGMVYVGFSGGKDSTVLKHLVDSIYSDVSSVFVNTGLEYPEIQRFVNECKAGDYEACGLNSNVEIVYPEKRFTEVLRENGYPVINKDVCQVIREGRIAADRLDGSYFYRLEKLYDTGAFAPKEGKKSQYSASRYNFMLRAPFKCSEECCTIMKKRPSQKYAREHKKYPILGTMASESRLRTQRWRRFGCNAFDDKKKPTSNPMSFWTEQDVLTYISDHFLPVAKVYGGVEWSDGEARMSGAQRTGCMFCMFGLQSEPEPNRFQKMKFTHPKQYEYCMKPIAEGGLGLKDVIDWLNENGSFKKQIKY